MTEPALARDVRGKGRHYEHPVSGELVPSVTNIIGILDKPAIPRWASRVVAEQAAQMKRSLVNMDDDEIVDLLKGAPWRKSGRAATRGTDIHAYLEAAMNGHDLPELEGQARDYQAAVESLLFWFEQEGMILRESEITVFGDGYAGTFDAHLLRPMPDGSVEDWLVDYKTGTSGPYDEVALQLSALAAARMKADKRAAWPDYDRLVAISIQPKGKFVVKQVADPAGSYEAFRGLLTAWHWKNGGKAIEELS